MNSSVTTQTRSGSASLAHPGAAATIGALTFALALAAGEVFDLNANPDEPLSAGDVAVVAVLAVAGMAIAIAVGMWGWRGTPGRLSGTALGLALAAAATFVAFWSGWPTIFGAVAIGLAAEHRRRVGAFSGRTIAAVVLGALAFAAAAFVCVIG
jgi:hypothetical protein